MYSMSKSSSLYDTTTYLVDVTTYLYDVSTDLYDVSTDLVDVTTSLDRESTAATTITVLQEDTNIRLAGQTLDIIYITVSLLSLTFNAVALLVFLSDKKMRSQLHVKFLVSQSVVDFLAGLFLLTNTLSLKSVQTWFSYGAYDTFLCKYWYSGFPLWVTLMASTHNLVALSIMKYQLVVHPLFFKVHFTATTAYLMIATTYVTPIVFYIALFEVATGVVDGQCYQISLWPSESVRLFFGVATYLMAYLLPILLHLYCYGRILCTLYRKSTILTSSSIKECAQRKAIKLLILVVAACIICLTWNLNILLLYYLGLDLDFQSWSYNVLVILLYTNCLVNPVIYVVFYRDYRNHLVQLLWRYTPSPRLWSQQTGGHPESGGEGPEITEIMDVTSM